MQHAQARMMLKVKDEMYNMLPSRLIVYATCQ